MRPVRAIALGNALAAVGLLAACSLAPTTPAPTVYDLGPLPAAETPASLTLPTQVQLQAPAWLDAPGIVYRLEYRDARQLSHYRDSRWAAPPAALLGERLRQRLARSTPPAGPAAATVAASLRVDLEEFAHVFATPERSRGLLRWRASLLDPTSGRVLAQRVFEQSIAAAQGDAAGGSRALTQAADAAIAELLAWLAARPG